MTDIPIDRRASPPPGRARRMTLPGVRLAMGITLAYLGLLVLIPLAGVALKATSLPWHAFWTTVTAPRAVASYVLTFGSAAIAASINAVFGVLVAWVLVRYRFPGWRVVDALVDLPFAMPTAVAGIALTAVYAPTGWIGRALDPLGIQVAFTRLGVITALTFIGLPFVVRTVQPVLQDLDPEVEEAAASLGASRGQVFWRVVFPSLVPALLTGFALALARGIGEYGSVIFISGNLPHRTEVTSLVIMTKLEQFDYAGATAVATVMLAASFLLLLAVNGLQAWAQRRQAPLA